MRAEDGRIQRFGGVGEDITDFVFAQAERERSRVLLDAALAALPTAIISTHATRATVRWNRAHEQLWGVFDRDPQTDVIARLRAEERLRRADRQKGVFLATLSHDLRNPLASIRTAAQFLTRSGLDEAQTRWALASVRWVTWRCFWMTCWTCRRSRGAS